MKQNLQIRCCVCDKIKLKKRSDGSTVWMARESCVIPGYKTAMETLRVSHGYCPDHLAGVHEEVRAFNV